MAFGDHRAPRRSCGMPTFRSSCNPTRLTRRRICWRPFTGGPTQRGRFAGGMGGGDPGHRRRRSTQQKLVFVVIVAYSVAVEQSSPAPELADLLEAARCAAWRAANGSDRARPGGYPGDRRGVGPRVLPGRRGEIPDGRPIPFPGDESALPACAARAVLVISERRAAMDVIRRSPRQLVHARHHHRRGRSCSDMESISKIRGSGAKTSAQGLGDRGSSTSPQRRLASWCCSTLPCFPWCPRVTSHHTSGKRCEQRPS